MTDATVLGCGFMGENHVRAVAEHPSLSLRSVVDVDANRAEEVADRYGAGESLTDYEAALDDADAAIVATPESEHEEQANAALDRGIHLLLEKPITDDLESASALADRSEGTDLVTGVSFVLRYDPAYARAREAARGGEVGEVVAARLKRGITIDESRRIGARGHPLYYMNVHDIDALLSCVDSRVREVRADERRGELGDVDVPDATQALLSFASGAIATIEGYGTLPPETPGGIEAAFELVGTRGTAEVTTPGDAIELTADGYDRPDTRHWPVVNGRMDGAVARQIDRFARAIDGDNRMLATVRDGYRAQRVARAIERAIDTGDAVDPTAID